MKYVRFLMPLVLFLLSCDAGTVDIKLMSFLKVEDATLPTFTDSVYVDVHDTLYLSLKDAVFYIKGVIGEDRVLIRFVKSEGRPVVMKDTVFLEHTSAIEVPSYIPLVINAISSDVYPSKVQLADGKFLKSTLGIDTECDMGPLSIKESYVTIRLPSSCVVKFRPEKGAVLRGNFVISSLALKRYRVDSAVMYLVKEEE